MPYFSDASAEDDNFMPKKTGKVVNSKAKKNPAIKIASGLVSCDAPPTVESTVAKVTKSVEEQYRKLTQLEHVLLRPDTYVGSVEATTETLWVYDEKKGIELRPITYVPGFYKIFDEILVNAADNKARDKTMDTLRVTIDRVSNTISVWNNGRGIPVQIHEVEGVYVPELIFGFLLTSSNYDDDEKKVTGGRNGYGAKLCNIFSSEFIVETADSASGKKFRQVFTDNMSKRTNPVISANTQKEDYTRITFKPDLSKFHLLSIDDDHEALLKKRVYDLAGTVKDVKVFLNGERLKIKSFKDYIQLYLQARQRQLQEESLSCSSSTHHESTTTLPPEEGERDEKTIASSSSSSSSSSPPMGIGTGPLPMIHEIVNDRWEIGITISDGQFQHVSFVNHISTSKGGTHVSFVMDPIVTKIVEAVNKKNKSGAPVKPFQVRNHMMVFVNCLVENPSFDSQTKETMTLRASAFGSKCDMSDDFIKKVLKSGIVETVVNQQQQRQQQMLKKSDGTKTSRLQGITKLDDANKAGTREAAKCTLILTEGDSAKALAVSGLSVVGRDYYGVFPLRGKLLNVREASHKQIMENAEINFIKQIMGLQHGKIYTSVESLRYGHLMIMTDQDHDGSHIKGLLINFLDHFWPSLLQLPGFLLEFITPIVKATRKRGSGNGNSSGNITTTASAQSVSLLPAEMTFFTMPEYHHWKETSTQVSHYSIKYYKGLGTSTSAEAKLYFSALDKHVKMFGGCHDVDRAAIDLAFSKKKADDRKEWLRQFVPGTFMNHEQTEIPILEFVNRELILFSMADNVRSIPSLVDGLKPGQRKILFSCFKRNLRGEIKVAQLAGYVSEHSAYHHGEQSLCSTIVNMAQTFVGSNNMNLMEPNGQFGTRIQGGKDAASARYIFTSLNPITRHVFHVDDDALLAYLNEDGQGIEPEFYMPILPMVLVNGGEGIGTGWSTSIPNYHPRELVDYLKYYLVRDASLTMGESISLPLSSSSLNAASFNSVSCPPALHPWYRGFTGRIEPIAHDKYKLTGRWRSLDATTIEIRELPLGVWTQTYKEFLEGLMVKSETQPKPWIQDFKEYHTDTEVYFVVILNEEGLAQLGSSSSSSSSSNNNNSNNNNTILDHHSMTATAEVATIITLDDELIEKKLKLSTTLSIANMVVFDAEGRIAKYTRPEDIIEAFYKLRVVYYHKRKQTLLRALREKATILENKVRFVTEVIDGTLVVSNRKRDDLLNELKIRGYAERKEEGKEESKEEEEEKELVEKQASQKSGSTLLPSNNLQQPLSPPPPINYDYLLSMPLWSLTKEKVEHLKQDKQTATTTFLTLQATSIATLWMRDLDAFLEVWNTIERQDTLEREANAAHNVETKKPKKPSTVSTTRKKSDSIKEVKKEVETLARQLESVSILDNNSNTNMTSTQLHKELPKTLPKTIGKLTNNSSASANTTTTTTTQGSLSVSDKGAKGFPTSNPIVTTASLHKTTSSLATTKKVLRKKQQISSEEEEEEEEETSDFSDNDDDGKGKSLHVDAAAAVMARAHPQRRAREATLKKLSQLAISEEDDDEDMEEEERDGNKEKSKGKLRGIPKVSRKKAMDEDVFDLKDDEIDNDEEEEENNMDDVSEEEKPQRKKAVAPKKSSMKIKEELLKQKTSAPLLSVGNKTLVKENIPTTKTTTQTFTETTPNVFASLADRIQAKLKLAKNEK